MTTTGWIIVWLVAALVPAFVAARKTPARQAGTFATYYVFGLLLWVAAVPAAIWAVKDERVAPCPHCLEKVKVGATVCPHCHRDLAPA